MDEINTGFPTFMKRFHNCNVKWSGVVVGAGPRSCLLKVKDPKDPTQMRMRANFSLDDDIVPSDLGAGSVVELQGTIVNLSERTIFVENAHDLQIVTKVTKVDEDKNKGAKR